MRLRRRKKDRRRLGLLIIPLAGLAALAYVGRRRLWQGVGLVASAVEEVADTVEDAAEDLRDTARERAAAD